MEVLQYWKVIRKSLWIIVLIVILGVGAAAVYTMRRPVKYVSTGTILLNPSATNALGFDAQNMAVGDMAGNYSALIASRSFGESVVRNLPFSMSPGNVAGAISASLDPNTLFYRVTARMPKPDQAQLVASQVITTLLSIGATQQERTNADQDPNSLKNKMRQDLTDKLTVLNQEITSYQGQISALEAQPPSKDRDDQLLQLHGQLVTLQQTQTDTMVALAQIGDQSAPPSIGLVIDEPLPGESEGSGLMTNLWLAAAVSLLLGIGIAFFRSYMDNTVHTPTQLAEATRSNSVTRIGIAQRIGFLWHRTKGRALPTLTISEENSLVTLSRPRSAESEGFRIMRTNVQLLSSDKPVRSILVTSYGPKEGKSFVASNLAIVMAQAGKRVVLVDADLRRPALHQVFHMPNVNGFADLIQAGKIKSATTLIAEVPNLAIIPSGSPPADSSVLLSSPGATQVMSALLEFADIVIYDSPPLGLLTDPVILATHVDVVILVARANKTRIDDIAKAEQILHNVGIRKILHVLNFAGRDEGSGNPRGYGGYYYSGRSDKPSDSGEILSTPSQGGTNS